MSKSKPVLKGLSGTLIIELDPTSNDYPDTPPASLSTNDAAELSNAISADLLSIVPELSDFGLIIPAGLYNQFEILKVGFPIQTLLQEIYIKSQNENEFSPTVIALGSDPDGFPIKEISPSREAGYGSLLLIPFAIIGKKADISKLDKTFDITLLENGDVSTDTTNLLNQKFGVTPINASYVSLANLCAIFKNQLESINCGPLWSLIESEFFTPETPTVVRSAVNNIFIGHNETVYTCFLTYNDWLEESGLERTESSMHGYLQWTAMQRQYTIGLESHGIEVFQTAYSKDLYNCGDNKVVPTIEGITPINKNYIIEVMSKKKKVPNGKAMIIAEQFHESVGTIAYNCSVTDEDDRIIYCANYYPLSFSAIEDVTSELENIASEKGLEVSKISELSL